MVARTPSPTRKKAVRTGKVDGLIYDANKHVEIITLLRAEGFSLEAVAEKIGITSETLVQWRKKYPEVDTALGDPISNGGIEPKYDALYHPVAVEYKRKVGKEVAQICKELEISKATYYRWRKLYLDFDKAAAINNSPVDNDMVDSLQKVARGYTTKKTKLFYEINTKRDKDGNTVREEVLVRKEVMEEDVPPNIAAIKAYLINRHPDDWTEKGREMTLNIKTDARELNPDEKKMQDVINTIPINDGIKMARIIKKMPAEVTVKWVETGNIKILGEYIVAHPELLEIFNENNQAEEKTNVK